MRVPAAVLALLTGAALLGGCHDTGSVPSDLAAERADAVGRGAPKFWDTNATASWNALATSLATRRVVDAGRLYAYLSLAQWRAAEAAGAIRPHPPTSSAIGAASATVLAAFFALDVAEIEAALDAQAAAAPWPGAKHEDFAQGEALGRSIGAQVLAFAAGDRVGLDNPGLPPAGPGYWVFNGALARGNYHARPFYLTSQDEVLPPPPPAYLSPEFNAALAEVTSIAANRTPEQLAIAQYWNVNQSGRSTAAMNNIALEMIRSHRVSDARAARILFQMSSAIFDALIGCFNAKYTYWYVRPPQANPAIVTAFPMPPHPSYPSGHSCVSGSATAVLAAAFPDEASRLEAIAIEASLSRLYAGIHYRFDMEAGLALGRAVAAKALAADLDEVAAVP